MFPSSRIDVSYSTREKTFYFKRRISSDLGVRYEKAKCLGVESVSFNPQ
jgi:hypothetical protein